MTESPYGSSAFSRSDHTCPSRSAATNIGGFFVNVRMYVISRHARYEGVTKTDFGGETRVCVFPGYGVDVCMNGGPCDVWLDEVQWICEHGDGVLLCDPVWYLAQ